MLLSKFQKLIKHGTLVGIIVVFTIIYFPFSSIVGKTKVQKPIVFPENVIVGYSSHEEDNRFLVGDLFGLLSIKRNCVFKRDFFVSSQNRGLLNKHGIGNLPSRILRTFQDEFSNSQYFVGGTLSSICDFNVYLIRGICGYVMEWYRFIDYRQIGLSRTFHRLFNGTGLPNTNNYQSPRSDNKDELYMYSSYFVEYLFRFISFFITLFIAKFMFQSRTLMMFGMCWLSGLYFTGLAIIYPGWEWPDVLNRNIYSARIASCILFVLAGLFSHAQRFIRLKQAVGLRSQSQQVIH